MRTVLSVKGVSKRFGSHAALDNISFEVKEREIVALLGDNGAGKSTLVKCIAGFHHPDEGDVALEGRRLDTETPRAFVQAASGSSSRIWRCSITCRSPRTFSQAQSSAGRPGSKAWASSKRRPCLRKRKERSSA